MDYFPIPLNESERGKLGRECKEALAVAAMQRLFLEEENDGTSEE